MLTTNIFLLSTALHLVQARMSPTNKNGGKHTTLAWHVCKDKEYRAAGLDCAELDVPIDWTKPGGDIVTLAMNRLNATDQHARIGSMIYNPGGPGESAMDIVLQFAVNETYLGDDVRKIFNIVGLDPRGIGKSSPPKCDADLYNRFPSLLPKDEDEFQQLFQFNRDFANSCLERTGPLVQHMDTYSVARDMDAVRSALGDDKLTYFGVSYGTQIGAAYAELFPQNIRAMFLDGNVDHSLDEVPILLSEIVSVEAVWKLFVEWCTNNPNCALHGQDIDALYQNLTTTAFRAPLSASNCVQSKTCRPVVRLEDITNYVQNGLIAKDLPPNWEAALPTWADLARDLADAFAGNITAFSAPFALTEDSYLWQGTLVNCLDWYHNVAHISDIRFLNDIMFTLAPHTRGVEYSYGISAGCANWPFALRDPPRRLSIDNTSTPILLLNAFYDPETPIDEAVSLHSQLPGSILVTNKKPGHGTYGYGGHGARLADAYLVNLTLPAQNTVVDD